MPLACLQPSAKYKNFAYSLIQPYSGVPPAVLKSASVLIIVILAFPLNSRGESSSAESPSGLLDTVRPIAGAAAPPEFATTSPIGVPFGGASDAGSGLRLIELWVRVPGGEWEAALVSDLVFEGTFDFIVTGFSSTTDGVYYFALVAQDHFGNRSADPIGMTGDGDGSTTFSGGSAETSNWSAYE